jgi:hypothetical protein
MPTSLPTKAHWLIDATDLTFSFDLDELDQHLACERISSITGGHASDYFPFCVASYGFGGGAESLYAVSHTTKRVFEFGDSGPRLANSGITTFESTFAHLDRFLRSESPTASLADLTHHELHVIDPLTYHESVWHGLVEHLLRFHRTA